MRAIALLTCCLLAFSAHAQTNRSSNYVQNSQQARQDYLNSQQLTALREQTAQIQAMQQAQGQQLQTLQAVQQQQAQMIALQQQNNALLAEQNELLREQVQLSNAAARRR